MPIKNEAQLEQALVLLATTIDQVIDTVPHAHVSTDGSGCRSTRDALAGLFASFGEEKTDDLAVVVPVAPIVPDAQWDEEPEAISEAGGSPEKPAEPSNYR